MALDTLIMSLARRPAAIFLVILACAALSRALPRCAVGDLKGLLPANASVEAVVPVESGGTYGEGARNLAYPKQPTDLPELCAVTVRVPSSSTSAYRFGLFLPTAWNGRFLAVGNGGFAGGINWLEMGVGVKYGFAVVSTDTGHSSTASDGSWALRSPEKRTDWGWRAMHGSVALGKRLVAAHYGRAVAYSYYSGCSTGGRQGLKEVQMAPASFDGVLVGAPAWWTTHGNTWITKAGTYNLPVDGPHHVPAAMFAPMAREVVRQCDGLDGLEDGIISAPEKCRPDYDVLSCSRPGAERSACLTSAQMAMPHNLYSDYRASTGELLYPGLWPGCEAEWGAVVNQTTTSPYGLGYARYFLFDNPEWSWTEYNDDVLDYAVRMDPGNATADKYDLSEFRARGGRLIMYHGLADGLMPPRGSQYYYDRVVAATSGANVTAARDFFRYFAVPGMEHCSGTSVDAPWAFGGAFQSSTLGSDRSSVPGFADARHDMLLTLVAWVEDGTAPDSVVATTWEAPLDAASGVLRQRTLCAYPHTARWTGSGDTNNASNWLCGDNDPFTPPESTTTRSLRAPVISTVAATGLIGFLVIRYVL